MLPIGCDFVVQNGKVFAAHPRTPEAYFIMPDDDEYPEENAMEEFDKNGRKLILGFVSAYSESALPHLVTAGHPLSAVRQLEVTEGNRMLVKITFMVEESTTIDGIEDSDDIHYEFVYDYESGELLSHNIYSSKETSG